MSTPATVGMVQRNGTINSIYVHFDGYPSNMIPILESLLDNNEMRKVIREGDASYLDHTVATSEFYARDRLENFEDVEPQTHQTLEEFESDSDAQYVYLVEQGKGVTLLIGEED